MRDNTSMAQAGLRLATIVLLSSIAWTAHAGPAEQAFPQGIDAAEQGDYEQAVYYFRSARDQGMDTPALHHNLGVAYYQLGRYEDARRSFKRAAETNDMRALAHYNLGLVAEAAGDDEGARTWYRKAYEEASTAKLRRLAANKLELKPEPVKPYTLYAEAFGGYDSNPRLTDDEAQTANPEDREGDAIFGAWAVGRYLLSGNWSNGFALYGRAYTSHYPDLGREDLDSVTAGGALYNRVGEWQHRYQLTGNHLRLGGDTLTDSVRTSIQARRGLTDELDLDLRLRAEYISGDEGSGFDYLTGWRADTRAHLAGSVGALEWQAGYEFEYNDRDDLSVGDRFFSVSPLRHEVGIDLEYPLIGRLRGMLDAEYRLSRYPDAEVRNEVRNGARRDEREDDRLSAGAGLSHPLGTAGTGYLEVNYRDNNSNFDRFDYQRTKVLLSIGRAFH